LAKETTMTDKNNGSLSTSTVLTDVDPDHRDLLAVRVVANDSAVSIFPEGYGDFGSAEGHGCPVFLELHQGKLRLIVFADINTEDPTHIIDLEGAREDRRIEDVIPSIRSIEEIE
jgi:hypothetical protein